MMRQVSILMGIAAFLWTAVVVVAATPDGPATVLELAPSAANPRNSEGDFVRLADGRVLFVYTHFTGGGGDHSTAHLASRVSGDGGKTWSQGDALVVANTAGMNVMSVSVLRLANGEIALFYLAKNSTADCRPVMRISTDEAKTWGEPVTIIPDADVAYYVMNNDRAVQLASGRLVAPVVKHGTPAEPTFNHSGVFMCYLSDDNGRTWRRSRDVKNEARTQVLQEPGVVELKDGRLMAFCRTTHGSQYLSYSSAGGETWTEFTPSNILSPCSPASIERIPSTGDLLLVWNNHDKIDWALQKKRTPYNVAISKDEGRSWHNVKTIADDPMGWYCYTAVEFVGDHVLLGYCASEGNLKHLSLTRVTRIPITWLYSESAR